MSLPETGQEFSTLLLDNTDESRYRHRYASWGGILRKQTNKNASPTLLPIYIYFLMFQP